MCGCVIDPLPSRCSINFNCDVLVGDSVGDEVISSWYEVFFHVNTCLIYIVKIKVEVM